MSGRELIAFLRRRIERLERPTTAYLRRRLRPEELPGARDERPVRFELRTRVAEPDARGTDVIAGSEFDVRGALFLDCETTGLSTTAGTLPFLIGYAWFEGDELVMEQLLMRSPDDERAALERLAQRAVRCTGLVTFNGRTFDIPLLTVRYVLRRMRSPFDGMPHLDLLPPSRRLFRSRMVSCRLVALEEGVLGQRRSDDVEGQFIPGLYSSYLQSGDASRLANVVSHNREDVLSMPKLLEVLARKAANPLQEAEDADELLAVGRMQLRTGDEGLALACLERATAIAVLPATRRRTLCALAQVLRRQRNSEALAQLWERYVREFPGENHGYEELAKVHERARRDFPAALRSAEAAPARTDALRRRIERINRRMTTVRTARGQFDQIGQTG